MPPVNRLNTRPVYNVPDAWYWILWKTRDAWLVRTLDSTVLSNLVHVEILVRDQSKLLNYGSS